VPTILTTLPWSFSTLALFGLNFTSFVPGLNDRKRLGEIMLGLALELPDFMALRLLDELMLA
jgi:hypothetical protein